MAYRTSFTGDTSKGSFRYHTSLINPSIGTPVERFQIGSGKRTMAAKSLRQSSAVSPRGPIARKAKVHYEHEGMNPYVMNEMVGTASPQSVETWYKLSFTGDTRVPSVEPVYMWGVDLPQQNPQLGGFAFEPFGYPFPGEVSDAAMARLFSSVRKQKDSGLDAALTLAELGQTWNLFATVAARVNRSYRELRRGKIREAARLLGQTNIRGLTDVPRKRAGQAAYVKSEAFINDYLAWTYGVRPLMQDIDAACHKLASLTASRPVAYRAVGYSSQAYAPETVVVRELIPGVQLRCTKSEDFELRVKHTLWYTVSDAMIAHASSMGFTNPMSLAWQTLPASFVFDWMFDVGTWLKGFSTFHGLQFKSGCSSRSGHHILTYHYGGNVEDRYDGYAYYDGSGVEQHLTYQSYHRSTSPSFVKLKTGGFRRDVWDSFPDAPIPQLKFPSSENDALGKLSSSLSMLAQRAIGRADRSAL